MVRAAIDGRALLRWILLELPDAPWPEREPFVGMVFLDGEAGLSAKGWRASAPLDGALVVRMPIGVPGRVLTDDEAAARGLPAEPPWLAACGPQPLRDAPWRHDPALVGKLHARFPDDVQALVHDGDPARTGRKVEGCWVRIDGADEGPPRPVTGRAAPTRVYRATLLSKPRALVSVAAGDRLGLLADAGGRYPVMVTPAYLEERSGWEITPCARCGTHEVLDPPSVLAAARPAGAALEAGCPACPGTVGLARTAGS